MNRRFLFDQLFSRTGGWSLIIIIAAIQIIALFGAIPGILSIQVNAEFDKQQLQVFSTMLPLLTLLSNLILLGICWWITRAARKRLNNRTNGSTKPNPDEEFKAWREITSLTWRYGISATIVIFMVIVLPIFFISSSQ